jgi:hypothetical protein
MSGVNPVYTLAEFKRFVAALKKAKLSVAISMKEDETALTTIAAPAPHYLESLGEMLQLLKVIYSIMQPTIRPLFNTKQFQEIY